MLEALVAGFRAGDRDEVAAVWSAFRTGIEGHMALEEECVLPELAKVDPSEAAALAREHLTIRSRLDELGIGVDLHCVNADTVERLIRKLRNHAQREDALMYRWAYAKLHEVADENRRIT